MRAQVCSRLKDNCFQLVRYLLLFIFGMSFSKYEVDMTEAIDAVKQSLPCTIIAKQYGINCLMLLYCSNKETKKPKKESKCVLGAEVEHVDIIFRVCSNKRFLVLRITFILFFLSVNYWGVNYCISVSTIGEFWSPLKKIIMNYKIII